MPHLVVKLLAGRSDEQKRRLADALTKAVIAALDSEEKSVSIAIEDVAPRDWSTKVYEPDIVGNAAHIYKQSGYTVR